MSERKKNSEEMWRGRATKEWENKMARKKWGTEETKKTENLKKRKKNEE